MLNVALQAAKALSEEGIEVAVLDLRWLCPLDEDGLYEAVKKAHGCTIVLHEANKTGGFGAEIVARLHELFEYAGSIRAVRIATPDMRMPASPVLQGALLPTAAKVIDQVRLLVKGDMTTSFGT